MNLKSGLQDLSVIYVLDPPALTRDSIILLSSIRQVLGDVKVIAYTPVEKSEFLFPYVTEFYKDMGAEIRLMDTAGRFDPPYKQGNKLLACSQPRDTEFTLFLDTDTAIVAPFERADLVQPGTVSVVPEGVQGWGGNPGAWEYVYAKFGLPFPEDQVRLIRSRKLSPPYFNAGMIAFPTHAGLSEAWLETSLELDLDPNVKNKRPWLDQIALPLAIARSGLKAQAMTRDWNLSISHPGRDHHMPAFLKDVNAVDARIVHFHQPKFFNQTRFLDGINAAIAGQTRFGSLSELTAVGDQQQERREIVWKRFGELKAIKDKTAEQKAEMAQLSREKNLIKDRRTKPELQVELTPDSIVRTGVSE